MEEINRKKERKMNGKTSKTSRNIKLTKNYKAIKNSMLEQLERSGNDTPYFKDLVDDYMKMYETKEMCSKDIEERGINIKSTGSQGQEIVKKNDSIDMMLKTNQQMIKLLDMMNIKIKTGEVVDDFTL